MRWHRPVRVLVALVGIGCAAALWGYSRRRPPLAPPPPVLDDQTVTSQRSGVLTTRANVHLGKDELKIEADIETGYADGRSRLQRAHFTSKRPNGTVFEIWAAVVETSGKAVTGDEPGLFHLSGGVRTRASDGLEVRTDAATYDNVQGLATIPGRLTFARDRLSGEGVGATYDRERDVLWLLDEARVTRAPDEKGEGGLEASAKGIGLARPDRFMNLRENARITQPGQVIIADQLIVHFREDDKGAEMIEMRGNAHLMPGASAGKDAPDMQADEMLLEFHEDGQTVRHAMLGGKARMVQTTDQGRQTITAAEIDAVLGPDGRRLTNLQAKGGVQVVLPASGENPDRDIRAASLVASGDAKNGLRAAVFDGGVTFVEKTGGAPRGAGRGAPAVDRTGTAASLTLDLKGQLGAIQSAEFRQGVVFQDRDMRATADKAIHNHVQGTLELTPAQGARTGARVEDASVRVDALWIQVDLTTHDVRAKDNVTARMQQGKPGGRETRTAAIFDADRPVYGKGLALRYVSASRAATFIAAAVSPARVYQEGANNWIEAADRIDVDQDTGNLTAIGHVRTSFLLEDGEPARGGRGPGAAAKATPAGGTATAQSAAPPARSGPTASPPRPAATVATAAEMRFIDAERKAVYRGEPQKPATLKGPDTDVAARDITLTLAKDQRALKTVDAVGEMSATFEGGREAIGDRLTYDATTETHVITGRPMFFKNVQNDGGRKSCSLEKSTVLHYEGKDQSIHEPGSATRALSASEQVACDKPLKTLVK